MSGNVLKGHLDLLLLAVLADGPRHGYAVIQELRRQSGGSFDLPEGTVYPALHRLESEKLLKSEWTVARGRRRRLYRTTRRGRSALEKQRGEWKVFSRAVGAIVGGEA